MSLISYEDRYRQIYMKVVEFIISTKNIPMCRENIIPLIKKIIKNYERFKLEIKDEREMKICDEYIKSFGKLIEIMKNI